MKLINPTPEELNVCFAEKVAGWKRLETVGEGPKWDTGTDCLCIGSGFAYRVPRYTQSAELVLPKLENWSRTRPGYVTINLLTDTWRIWLDTDPWTRIHVSDSSFAHAAVIALLRAHGVEVEFTTTVVTVDSALPPSPV
jgi:hypothetical protein